MTLSGPPSSWGRSRKGARGTSPPSQVCTQAHSRGWRVGKRFKGTRRWLGRLKKGRNAFALQSFYPSTEKEGPAEPKATVRWENSFERITKWDKRTAYSCMQKCVKFTVSEVCCITVMQLVLQCAPPLRPGQLKLTCLIGILCTYWHLP